MAEPPTEPRPPGDPGTGPQDAAVGPAIPELPAPYPYPYYPVGPTYSDAPAPFAPLPAPPRFPPQLAEKPFKPRRFRLPRSPLHEVPRATLRTFIVASAVIFGPAAVVDVFTGIAKPAPLTLFWAFGIALAMAVVNGIVWSVAFGLIRKLPRFAPWVIWPAAAIGLGAWLAN